MKKSIIFCFLAALVFFSCRKSDNPKLPELEQVSVPKITLDATSDKFINASNPSLFKAVFVVDHYFQDDLPGKYDVVVRKTRGTTTIVKVIKEGITTFPSTISVTGQQLIDLFGQPIAGGDLFDFGADVYNTAGKKFDAFPAGGTAYGSGIANLPGGSTSVSFIAPCTFVADAYAGDFVVVSDEWNDYKAGTVIPVKKVSDTKLSFEYNVDPGTAKPIIMTINPVDNTISVTKQVYGSYGTDEFSAQSVAGAASAVNPCDVSLSVRLNHTTTGYSNNFTIKLKKK